MRGRVSKPLDANALMNYAARLLSARALSVSELREKLRRRASQTEDVDGVLSRLKTSGYLDDRKFANSFASWRRENQGFGKSRVLRDLLARRVAPAVAGQAAEAAFQGSDEIALIEQFLERKYRGKNLGALLAEEKHLASAYRKLRLGGFSSGNSIRVLKRYAAEADRLEGLEE
ncbi:MAG TPA: RecX family transcriptional regulator [Bryobacteraceae bacterium]|nr:RecX family transcriptional regulator [Bryobacteraceae bacterium]